VLRGIDAAFDRYDARKGKGKVRRINGLAWCAQEVMTAAEEMREASVGAGKPQDSTESAGLAQERVAAHLAEAAEKMRKAKLTGVAAQTASEIADRLIALVAEAQTQPPDLESLERTLTALEDKLLMSVMASASEEELTALREQSAQELAPYRRRMQALQIRQIEQQFLQKRLLEKHDLPRLSLFYMRQD